MEPKIKKLKKLRLFLLDQVSGLTTAQLNVIPAMFHNNIIWNLGHLICVEQDICYVRAGLPAIVEERYTQPFMPGTRPEEPVPAADIHRIRELLIRSAGQLQEDYEQRRFDNYIPPVMIPRMYGFEIRNIDEALEYLLHHEGYHSGCIRSLMRLVSIKNNG